MVCGKETDVAFMLFVVTAFQIPSTGTAQMFRSTRLVLSQEQGLRYGPGNSLDVPVIMVPEQVFVAKELLQQSVTVECMTDLRRPQSGRQTVTNIRQAEAKAHQFSTAKSKSATGPAVTNWLCWFVGVFHCLRARAQRSPVSMVRGFQFVVGSSCVCDPNWATAFASHLVTGTYRRV